MQELQQEEDQIDEHILMSLMFIMIQTRMTVHFFRDKGIISSP